MAQAFGLAREEGRQAYWLNLYHRAASDGLASYLGVALADRRDGEEHALLVRRAFGLDALLTAIDAICRRAGSISLYVDEVAAEDMDELLGLSCAIGKHLGMRARMIVAARAVPPRWTAMLGGHGIIHHADDLAFTVVEIGELFGGGLSEPAVDMLLAGTGGCPALVTSVRHGLACDHATPLPALTDAGAAQLASLVRDIRALETRRRDIGHCGMAIPPRRSIAPCRTTGGPRLPTLAPREQEVLRHIVGGLSSREIASEMDLSPGTISGYRKTLYRKLGVSSRSAVVSRGREMLDAGRPAPAASWEARDDAGSGC
ncbi:helix-turn-helix transcriptional regulator [Rhizorhabdus wittichii]|nr:LuxR C-terminal-related transcriptional regulator [Rhizorhabdus wittichii]